MSAFEIALAGHHEGVETSAEPSSKTRTRRKVLTRRIPIAEIERDPAINCRAGGVRGELTAEYCEAIKAGANLPPVVVFRDSEGKRWLADGFHRISAHELIGLTDVAVDEREGDRRAALLYAAGANASHGARRTNADKRRAVGALLADPEWATWSDQIIAERCAVSQPFVSTLRRSTQNGSELPERRGKDGKVRRAPKRAKRVGFRRIPASYRAACDALGRLSTAWAKRKPIDPHLAEARRALDELERQHAAEE